MHEKPWLSTGLWLAGNYGMENRLETAIMGYIGSTTQRTVYSQDASPHKLKTSLAAATGVSSVKLSTCSSLYTPASCQAPGPSTHFFQISRF